MALATQSLTGPTTVPNGGTPLTRASKFGSQVTAETNGKHFEETLNGNAFVYTIASNRLLISSPAGNSAFESCTAAATWVDVRPRACALTGSTTTLISRWRPPLTPALATPEMPSSRGSMLFIA